MDVLHVDPEMPPDPGTVGDVVGGDDDGGHGCGLTSAWAETPAVPRSGSRPG
jgi:hypothetical protein